MFAFVDGITSLSDDSVNDLKGSVAHYAVNQALGDVAVPLKIFHCFNGLRLFWRYVSVNYFDESIPNAIASI